MSTSLNIGSLNHTTIHGSTESIASIKPSGKQHTNGIDKILNASKQNMGQQKMSASTLLQKSFTSDNKMLSAVGLDSRPGTPKDVKDSSLTLKGDLTPNTLKHKPSSSSTSGSSSVKKSNNKKARHR